MGGCRDLGLGQFCCPGNSNTTQSVCCNTDPNPPTTQAPVRSASASTAASIQATASMNLAVSGWHSTFSKTCKKTSLSFRPFDVKSWDQKELQYLAAENSSTTVRMCHKDI